MSTAEEKYRAALHRLENNTPKILEKGSFKINNDQVAIEAGNKPGSIKKARFKELINDIAAAEDRRLKKQGVTPPKAIEVVAKQRKSDLEELDKKYQAALVREVNLVRALRDADTRISELESQVKVITIKRE